MKYKYPINTQEVFDTLATGEMKIKGTLRLHLTQIRIAVIKKTNVNKCL